MTNGGPSKPKPNPWPMTIGCLGAVLMLCVAAVLVAWIVYGG